MTTLVTGGTGFIGGNLVRELIKENEDVRVLARRSSNTKRARWYSGSISLA